MGMWNMTVVGTGCHHNYERDPSDPTKIVMGDDGKAKRSIDYDADVMFKEFVEKLRAKGHHIEHASFTYGGRES